jgi:SAM-dependent methyltransferase
MYDYSFIRYLSAKKSVDDRALNRQVWETMRQTLPTASAENPLRVLELGAGIGTMIERMSEWGALSYADYTAIDVEPANIIEARERTAEIGRNINLTLESIDVFDFIAREKDRQQWDLLIAHALLDLFDIPTALPKLLTLLRPGGLFYFTINFDGATIFEPTIDPQFDALVEKLYHATMDARLTDGKPSGDSRAGRHLFQHLRATGTEILAAGSSDWVVFAGENGYSADEAYFLHFIVNTVAHALTDHPDLDPIQFSAWIAQRHRQIDNGELVYIAHQLDFFGRMP